VKNLIIISDSGNHEIYVNRNYFLKDELFLDLVPDAKQARARQGFSACREHLHLTH
jgi:hypothetical protein